MLESIDAQQIKLKIIKDQVIQKAAAVKVTQRDNNTRNNEKVCKNAVVATVEKGEAAIIEIVEEDGAVVNASEMEGGGQSLLPLSLEEYEKWYATIKKNI